MFWAPQKAKNLVVSSIQYNSGSFKRKRKYIEKKDFAYRNVRKATDQCDAQRISLMW